MELIQGCMEEMRVPAILAQGGGPCSPGGAAGHAGGSFWWWGRCWWHDVTPLHSCTALLTSL